MEKYKMFQTTNQIISPLFPRDSDDYQGLSVGKTVARFQLV